MTMAMMKKQPPYNLTIILIEMSCFFFFLKLSHKNNNSKMDNEVVS